jgi:transcriptional regulator with XRE-family HTH domain
LNDDSLDEYRKRIGTNIRNARIQAGYRSQRKLAEKLSFTHDKLARIERGETTASSDDINEIARVLGISPEVIRGVNSSEKQRLIKEIEHILDNNGDLNRACELASQLSNSSSDLLPSDRFYIHIVLGKIHLKQKNYDSALDSFKKALSETSFTKDVRQIIAVYKYMSYTHLQMNDYISCLNYIKITISLSNDDNEIRVLRELEKLVSELKDAHFRLVIIFEKLLFDNEYNL